MDCDYLWCYASRISRRDVRVVLAHCRRWRWRWRRGRSNAVRARSRNALEAGVRAHNLRTCTTEQEAQSGASMNVHVRIGVVSWHVVNHTIETKRGAIGDTETDTSETAGAIVIAVTDVVGYIVLKAITSASSA